MNIFVCKDCGHIEFGSTPDKCPVCFAIEKKFEINNNVFIDAERKSKEASINHAPVIKTVEKNRLITNKQYTDVLVRIGERMHPMKKEHYIGFIDCYLDNKYVSRIMLTPFMIPFVVFHLLNKGSKITVVESCNIHGHWMTEAKF